MAKVKGQILTLVTGTGLVVAGLFLLAGLLLPIPLGEVFLIVGGSIASFSYGLVFLKWVGSYRSRLRRTKLGSPIVPSEASRQPEVSETTMPASLTPPSCPQSPSTVTMAQLPPMPSPSVEKPSRLQKRLRLSSFPPWHLPKPVTEQYMPISLIGMGLLLITGGIYVLFGPAPAFFTGLFIPGLLLLGAGSTILFLHLYPRQVAPRRFCMHCGYVMSITEPSCGRCHKQPPSGVDTKVCANCVAVVPATARFCKDCGAGQPIL